jgi:predicted nucleic acid-binding protein
VIVLDASAVIAWAYGEEGDRLDALIREVATTFAAVPGHWVLEVADALLLGERHRRIKAGERDAILARIQELPVRVDDETFLRGWQDIPELAARHRLTTYDAAYLELAQRLQAPLATLDRDLTHAARTARVRLYEI